LLLFLVKIRQNEEKMPMIRQRKSRRSFLQGAASATVLLPAGLAHGQGFELYPPVAAPAPAFDASARNQSSFSVRHWSDFYPSLGKGVILADVTSRALFYWSADESVRFVFPCAIPMTDELTKRGQTEVVRKMANPPWTPTPSMREKDPDLPQRVEGGAPDNPLGPFGIYLSWPAYLIHGTHDTRKIGRKSSAGCYGLYNEHVAKLFPLVEIGTQVAVF
jgi:L,D-transpeptidase ErfK/SrfK